MSDSLNRSEGKNMKIERFVLGPIETNCYVVVNEDTKECFAVDMAYCPQEYVDHIREQGYQMKALFLTHGHFDHIMGIEDFLKAFDVPVYVGREEQPLLADDRLNASSMYGYHCAYTGAKALEDGQTVECAGTEIHVIHTPGHTVLSSGRGSTVLWRYFVLWFDRKDRSSYRKQPGSGTFYQRKTDDPAG